MIETTTMRARCERWLTHDYLPGANRYVYWMKTPLGVLILACAASLACGVCVAPQGFVLAGVSGAIIGLGIVWPWLGMRGVSAELHFEQSRAREGQCVSARVVVQNRWPFPIWGLAVQQGFHDPRDDVPAPIAVALARVPAWSRTTFDWNFTPTRRGEYPRSTPRIVSGFPFGIWHSQKPIIVKATVLVWPRVIPLSEFPLPESAKRRFSMPSERFAGLEGDRFGVRPYRQGDSLRHVHWALSARHDRLIVCERQGIAHATVCIQLDDRADHHVGADANSSWEWSLRCAASLVTLFWEQGAHVMFKVGETLYVPGAHSRDVAELLDVLACCELNTTPFVSAKASRHRATESGLTFRITTDLDSRVTGARTGVRARQIVLRASLSSDSPVTFGARDLPDAWMVLDDWNDVAQQLVFRWRQQCQGVWHAA